VVDFVNLGLVFSSSIFLGVIPFILFSLAIPYAVLRLQNVEPVDPQLGSKVGLQYFFSVALMIMITGLTIMAVDLSMRDELFGIAPPPPPPQPMGFRPKADPADKDLFNSAQRTGFAMVLSGLLLGAVHVVVAFALTDRAHWLRVRRTFVGWRFAIHGIVVMFSFTVLVILLLRKDFGEPATFRAIRGFLAVLAVWIPSWIVHVALLKLYAWLGRTAPISKPVDGDEALRD
jgi:hypothetical protein